MFGVMIVMLSGVLIGYILRNIRAIPALVSKINIYIIFLLLFVMGLSVGSNPGNPRPLRYRNLRCIHRRKRIFIVDRLPSPIQKRR